MGTDFKEINKTKVGTSRKLIIKELGNKNNFEAIFISSLCSDQNVLEKEIESLSTKIKPSALPVKSILRVK